jgi:hypothetical protein
MTSPRTVVVHIDRVVVHGLELGAGGADRLRAALAAELQTSLGAGLGEGSLPPSLMRTGSVGELPSGEVRLGAAGRRLDGRGADAAGRAVGGHLGRRLGGPGGGVR